MRIDTPIRPESQDGEEGRTAIWRAWLAQPWVARLAATLGIIITTQGLLVPFVGRDLLIKFSGGDVLHSAETWSIDSALLAPLRQVVPLQPLSVTAYLLIDAALSLIGLGGLALIPLLWLARGRTGIVWARRLYGAWLSCLLLLAMVGLVLWRQLVSQEPTRFGSPDIAYALGPLHLLPGVVVFPLGALLASGGLYLISQMDLPLVESTARSRWQWAAATTLTVGMLTWLIGFYLMPEAITAACPPMSFSATQFAHGACAGLDSDQVMAAASNAGLPLIGRLLYNVGAYFELLVALGLITTFYSWIKRLSAPALAWLAIWPALAFGVALVALRGVGAAAQAHFTLSATAGSDWRVASGLIVTFLGIALTVLGELGLWSAWLQQRSQRRLA
jgi:hypothetical protein